MFKVKCKHGQGVRIGGAFVLLDHRKLEKYGLITLLIDAPGDIQIDILKQDNRHIPEKILKALT